jgi:hypothetical protein
MSANQRQKTRLGDLLVERGLISEEQLLLAIQEQRDSGLQLGEILVKRGWIAKRHIRKTLRVQSKIRNAILTSILSFSPMLLVGCGSSQGQVESSETIAEQSIANSQGQQNGSDSAINADDGSTIHLSWDYPLERTDGSELEVFEIESFRVYQLDGNGDVGAVHVVDGLETEYDIPGLEDGEYRFAVTVVDTDGLESDYSQVVTVSVL